MIDPRLEHCAVPMTGFTQNRKRIVLSGSMTFYGEMLRIKDRLDERFIHSTVPDAEDDRANSLSPDEYERFKRRVSLAHMRRVRHRLTFGVLVVNLDKRGIADYIGPSTFAEI